MSQNNIKPTDFLTPETLATIVLIQEVYLESDPCPPELSSLLINKIQKFYTEGNSPNLEYFLKSLQNDLESKNLFLVNRIREQFSKFIQFNDVFKYLSTTLTALRSNRNGKLEQGNIIDIFVRRSLLNFKKWSFNELVRFYAAVQNYKNPYSSQNQMINSFAIEKKLECLKSSLETSSQISMDSNFQGYLKEIKEIKPLRTNNKMNFLEYKINIKNTSHLAALENLHKYFDKSLNYLLQISDYSSEKPVSTNKINHAILNLANLNFMMGFYDEVLRGISEALRISQNNSDDEGINHCLCYLYQIAGIIGNHEDQINLLEYAISHSFNLNQPNLMLFSCLYYCNLERFYQMRSYDTKELKPKNISWINDLHYASKKIITTYESGFKLKELSQLKGLVIPRALESIIKSLNLMKLAKPNVALMQIATIFEGYDDKILAVDKISTHAYEAAYYISKYDWQQGLRTLLEGTRINKSEWKENSYFSYYWLMIHYDVFKARGMFDYCDDIEELIAVEFKNLHEITLYCSFWSSKIEKMLAENLMEQAYYSSVQFIHFCEKKGLEKMCLKGYINQLEGYYRIQNNFQGLILLEEILLKINQYEAFECEAIVLSYKAGFLRNLGLLCEAFHVLKDLERDSQGKLYNSDLKTQAFFYEIKGLCLLTQEVRNDSENNYSELLKSNALEALNFALQRYIALGNLEKCKEIYYIQARVLDEMERKKEREEIAGLFLQTIELQEKIRSMRHIGVDVLKSLELFEWQMNIAKIIEENLNIVDFFT